jgi:hypothetical protein
MKARDGASELVVPVLSDPKRPAGRVTLAELGNDYHIRRSACQGVETRKFGCRKH